MLYFFDWPKNLLQNLHAALRDIGHEFEIDDTDGEAFHVGAGGTPYAWHDQECVVAAGLKANERNSLFTDIGPDEERLCRQALLEDVEVTDGYFMVRVPHEYHKRFEQALRDAGAKWRRA